MSSCPIHRGSAESTDSDDHMETKVDAISRQLDDMERR